ncbi:hypothetical protein [Bacteroides sp.]|uniref:hypothetical protein n=1 Tax=Bacteroides sp. TaxID=29523 RepID=UPI0026398E7C|nr:hypothetical protein [Bacteroides sp.]MDD3038303.1 hypothetical protein [Bacteroides sp.]
MKSFFSFCGALFASVIMGACGNDNFISDEVKMDEMSNQETNLERDVVVFLCIDI